MPSMGLIVFLAFCAFLCTTRGANSLSCTTYKKMDPKQLVIWSSVCEAQPGETCHVLRVSKGRNDHKRILSCQPTASAQCGTTEILEGLKYEYLCCDDKDWCNERLAEAGNGWYEWNQGRI